MFLILLVCEMERCVINKGDEFILTNSKIHKCKTDCTVA